MDEKAIQSSKKDTSQSLAVDEREEVAGRLQAFGLNSEPEDEEEDEEDEDDASDSGNSM